MPVAEVLQRVGEGEVLSLEPEADGVRWWFPVGALDIRLEPVGEGAACGPRGGQPGTDRNPLRDQGRTGTPGADDVDDR